MFITKKNKKICIAEQINQKVIIYYKAKTQIELEQFINEKGIEV